MDENNNVLPGVEPTDIAPIDTMGDNNKDEIDPIQMTGENLNENNPIRDDNLAMLKEKICQKVLELYDLVLTPEQVMPLTNDEKKLYEGAAGKMIEGGLFRIMYKDETTGEEQIDIVGDDGVKTQDADLENDIRARDQKESADGENEATIEEKEKAEEGKAELDNGGTGGKESHTEEDAKKHDPEEDKLANKLGVNVKYMATIRQNSNIYRNYPQLREELDAGKHEKHVAWWDPKDGRLHMKIVDGNGNARDSQILGNGEEAKSVTRSMEVNTIDKEGNMGREERSFQIIKTSNLDKGTGVKDSGIIMDVSRGYLQLDFARQNHDTGDWESYPIEQNHKDYNDKDVNDATRNNGTNDPFVLQNTTFAPVTVDKGGHHCPDHIEMGEYLKDNQLAEKFIHQIMSEDGFNREEALDVLSHMMEEGLTREDSEKLVREEIKQDKELHKQEEKDKGTERDRFEEAMHNKFGSKFFG